MSTRYRHAMPPRTSDHSAALDRVDECMHTIASSLGALEMQYPALIARDVLEDAEYPKAFPHLLMSATRLDAPEMEAAANDADGHGWCLSPAVCYHAYAQCAGRSLSDPIVLSARGRCFRAERVSSPGTRQVEFDMREIVLLGEQEWIEGTVEVARSAIESLARAFDLTGDWEASEDPFFLPAAAGKAMLQRLLKVKLEYQWPSAGGLALASVNRHRTFFGERFHISSASGQPIHTACVAVGLDRWAYALEDTRQKAEGARKAESTRQKAEERTEVWS